MSKPKTRKPRKPTKRQEIYARLIAAGTPPYRAYPAAGFEQDRGEPYRALARPGVQQALHAENQKISERYSVTREIIAADLAEDRALAHEVGQAGAAVAATGLKARLYGLLQPDVDTRAQDAAAVAVAELARRIAWVMQAAGERGERGAVPEHREIEANPHQSGASDADNQ